jgi:hypothetical protein
VIAVVGSVHDRVAASMVASWPSAHLLSAEDLTSAGWVWGSEGKPRRWVIDGQSVEDEDITGVFIRRSTVYPEELLSIHPDDRAYLAAEAHAFLIAVLASTQAIVVNPVGDGALGDEALRPERWIRLAAAANLNVRPIRLTSWDRRERSLQQRRVEVVADRPFGDAPARCRLGAVDLVRLLGLRWASCVFDGHYRLLAVTTVAVPSDDASGALAELLAGGAS